MTLAQHLGKHFRQAYFGGSFTERNLRDELSAIPLAAARRTTAGGNSVIAIVYHLHFYVRGVAGVLGGGPVDTRDRASWETPAIDTEGDWRAFVTEVLTEGEAFAKTLEALPDEELWKPFYRPTNAATLTNALGILEHVYYHLGQVVLLARGDD